MPIPHFERHRSDRIGWLRAVVLGANDGIVSTASLIVGVAAANAPVKDVLVAGVAGLVAGAMSMAAGEYVSVSSQSDTEQADLARERHELANDPEFELADSRGDRWFDRAAGGAGGCRREGWWSSAGEGGAAGGVLGALAMALTAAVGKLFGTTVA